MKKINLLLILSISLFAFFGCEENEDVIAVSEIDYVSFEIDFAQGVDAAIATSLDVRVFTSTIASSDRTINLIVDTANTTLDASAYTAPTSVTIPANSNEGTFAINIDGPNVGAGGVLVFDFNADSNIAFTGDPVTINVFPVCFDNTPNLTLTLDITFDSWPEEIYWVIEDSAANVIAESAPGAFGGYAGLTGGISQDFCLSDGTYTFTIYDQFGDGAGAYSLTYNDGTIVHNSSGGYGGGEVIPFSLGN